MINIYEGTEPLILQHGVNGKNGFVILPEGADGDDMDGIYFEDWATVTAFVQALSKLTSGDPAEVESYDDWVERTQP
jgi:hypothetical protein